MPGGCAENSIPDALFLRSVVFVVVVGGGGDDDSVPSCADVKHHTRIVSGRDKNCYGELDETGNVIG